MLTSLYTAVSGMSANGTLLSVVSDNISNMNTVGFKGSNVTFGDVLSQTLSGISAAGQVGRGTLVSSITPAFTQGSFETTASALDMAVQGEGFFTVSDGLGKYYTRDGQFHVDKDGNLANPDGLLLQGYQADGSGNITGTLGDLNVLTSQSRANGTTKVNLSANLDGTSAVKTWAFTPGTVQPPDPTTYNSSTTVTVYDSQGGAHDVTAYVGKTADNKWDVNYVYKDSTGNYQQAAGGPQHLVFGADGSLQSDDSDPQLTFKWGGGVLDSTMTFDFGLATDEDPNTNGFSGSTQFAAPFAVTSVSQDGYSSGTIQSLVISSDGNITGTFTNGQTKLLGQVALSKFVATSALTKLGRNLYGQTFESGQPIIGKPTTSGIGSVVSNTIELSNVDLADQFVKMIAAQRGFEANSKIITTTDQLYQELVNMKQ